MATKKSELAKMLLKTALLYDKPIPSDERLDAWFDMFSNYDSVDLEKAFNRHTRNGKFFPKPAEIIDCYQAIRADEESEKKFCENDSEKNDCPWCAGTGWFRTEDKYGYSFVCRCQCRGDASNLNKALACPDYVFNAKLLSFVPRTGWIGDETDSTLKKTADKDVYFNNLNFTVKSL